jgi:hypothetical protein
MAGRRYSVAAQDTNTAATSQVGVTSAATIRPKIYDLICGSDATPADNAAEYNLQRDTAAGTATSFTPVVIDPGDPAALSSAGYNHSVEPTYTANALLLEWAQNQRATFRWVAAPEGELVLPATAANGAGIQTITVAGSAVNTNFTIHYAE